MDLRTLIESTIINEMARKVEHLNMADVKKSLEELKSVGIDLSNYTFDEIQMAFFLNLDEMIRGTTPKHQETVISFWKPGVSNPFKVYRDMRNPFISALNIDLDTVKSAEFAKNDKDDRNAVRVSFSRKELINIAKDPEALEAVAKHMKDNIKLKQPKE